MVREMHGVFSESGWRLIVPLQSYIFRQSSLNHILELFVVVIQIKADVVM